MRRVLAAITGIALLVAAVRWILNPKTPLRYPFPRSATEPCEGGDANPTDSAVEGPVYRPNTPERKVIRDAASIGRPLFIDGRVHSTAGEPLRGAVLDFWNCDGNGHYDMTGYRLRGHQYSDWDGAYRLETVKPGDYEQLGFHRTPHVHVKVQAPGHASADDAALLSRRAAERARSLHQREPHHGSERAG